MTRERLFELHQEMTAKAFEILKAKNADYSKGTPLGNFYVTEAIQAGTAENGIIIRLSDKISRLVSVLEKGLQVKTESAKDTILDIINYAVLLAAVVEDKETGTITSSHAEEEYRVTAPPGWPGRVKV